MDKSKTVNLFGWQWLAMTKQAVVKQLLNQLSQSSNVMLTVATGNPEQVMLARRNSQFFQTMKNDFDWILPDGEGIIWASRRRAIGKEIPERVAGVEVVSELLSQLPANFGPILVVGGRGYQGKTIAVADGVWTMVEVQDTKEKNREQRIFWLPAYQDAGSPTAVEEAELARVLSELKPKLVLVALGAPQQEFWVAKHKQQLHETGVRVVMVVGGAFDMLTGMIPRAPLLIRQLKFEWLWRLLQEPSRWRRQLMLLKFITLALSRAPGKN